MRTIRSCAGKFRQGVLDVRRQSSDVFPPGSKREGPPRSREIQAHAPAADFGDALASGEAFHNLRKDGKCAEPIDVGVQKFGGNRHVCLAL